MTITRKSPTTFAVQLEDAYCTIEVHTDGTLGIYAPMLPSMELVGGGVEGVTHHLALTRDFGGKVRKASGVPYTNDAKKVVLADKVGDVGRSLAKKALALWDRDPSTPDNLLSAKVHAISTSLAEAAEEQHAISTQQAKLSAASQKVTGRIALLSYQLKTANEQLGKLS